MDTLPIETLEYLLSWIVELDDYHRVRRVCVLWKTLMLQILKRKIKSQSRWKASEASGMRIDVLLFHSGVPVIELEKECRISDTLEPIKDELCITTKTKPLDLHRFLFKTEIQGTEVRTGVFWPEYDKAGKTLINYEDLIFKGTFTKEIYRYLGYACVADTLKKGIDSLKVFNPAYLPKNFRVPIAH